MQAIKFPVPNRSEYIPSPYEPDADGVLDIGYYKGSIIGGRPYVLECWQMDELVVATVFFSDEGLDAYSREDLVLLLEFSHFLNSRNKIRFALPRPRWISMPECPPFKPPTAIQKALYPSGTISSRYVMRTEASKPPAHPTYSSPSVSESRLTSISPSSIPPFRPRAPSMPVSSVAVISASNGPCTTSSDSITAKIAATPIPLSAPSVVPSAAFPESYFHPL